VNESKDLIARVSYTVSELVIYIEIRKVLSQKCTFLSTEFKGWIVLSTKIHIAYAEI